jgi:hypothetical protein
MDFSGRAMSLYVPLSKGTQDSVGIFADSVRIVLPRHMEPEDPREIALLVGAFASAAATPSRRNGTQKGGLVRKGRC